MEYLVSIEREGKQVLVGTIGGEDSGAARFSYVEKYLNDPEAAAISIHLPLQKEAFSPADTKLYFEGLLPEGFTRRSVAQWMHLDENDYLSILHGLGRECLGAVRVSAPEDRPEEAYESVSAEQVQALAAEGATRSAEMVTKAHLSLTGASGKVGLYFDSKSEKWFLPKGTAPSTHIVKQSHVRLDGIVTNEQLSLLTASGCGIEIPESFIINTGNGEDSEILFATRRYDRVFPDQARRVDDLPCPYRLHQEDFSQALGIPASEKYERESGQYMKKMFDLLRVRSADPVKDQLRLWDCIVFSYLIGNTDAHIKNYSLLYSPDLKKIRLAPAYDIISTTVYEASTREMSFHIGGRYLIEEIDREAFREAAGAAGLGEKMAMRRFDAMYGNFREKLRSAAETLEKEGYRNARDMEERILRTGGYGRL